MSEIVQVTQAIFGDTPLRTGYSEATQASYVIAADMKGAMNYNSSLNSFLRGLEKVQETAGQVKEGEINAPLYVGTEIVETAGGRQKMKVVYKRGVFHLLMTSRREEAATYRDRVFNVLEQIERRGYYIQNNATEQQLDALREELGLHELAQEVHQVQIAAAKAEGWKQGVKAGRYSSRNDETMANPYSDEVLALLPKYVEQDEFWAIDLQEEFGNEDED